MDIELRRDLEQRLLEYVNDYGIPLTENQARLMVAHLDLVIEKNKVVNLTRIIEPAKKGAPEVGRPHQVQCCQA